MPKKYNTENPNRRMYRLRINETLKEKEQAMSRLVDLPNKMRNAMSGAFEEVTLVDEVAILAISVQRIGKFKPNMKMHDADWIKSIANELSKSTGSPHNGLENWIIEVAAKLK